MKRGFTLLEVLIAFAIAAFALAVLTRSAATGLQSAAAASHYQEALSRARSHLAALQTGLQQGDQQGDDGGGFTWRLRTVVIATAPAPSRAGGQQGARPTLYRSTVTMSWTMDGGTRSVELTTERLGSSLPDGP